MATPAEPPIPETLFVNEIRLNPRQWCLAAFLLAAIVLFAPRLWSSIERFERGPDYRIPYSLSKDYWLYNRRVRELKDPQQIILLGDSVVWGEYVLPDGALSHYLDKCSGETNRFINGGVNGLFPLALEGLVTHYGKGIQHRKVILHWNALWMSSPKVDLQTQKEEKFNHTGLVPQFRRRIPCYKADVAERLGIVIERNVPFLAWVDHLQTAYFGQQNILAWTLSGNGSDPKAYTNTYKNPLGQITLDIPAAPLNDPDRGPASPRHKPWSTTGVGTQRFEWVDPKSSLQWAAFQRLIRLLRDRQNELLVVIGPFNEHILTPENRSAFRKLRDGVVEWLEQNRIPYSAPETLPSELYADASHPLTEGYEAMAKALYSDPAFQAWQKSRVDFAGRFP